MDLYLLIIYGKKKEEMKKWINWIFVILWMLLIFYFSNQTGTTSTETSNFFVLKIKLLLENIFPMISVDILTLMVRKIAHATIYLILGILIMNAIKDFSNIKLALLICLLYACSDEIHQLFVNGRSGELKDVVIDFIGSSVGVYLVNKFHKHSKIA